PMSEEAMSNALLRRFDDQEGQEQKSKLTSAATTDRERDHIIGVAMHREFRENPTGTVRRRLWAGLCFVFGEQFLKHPEVWVDGDLMTTPGKFDSIPPWLGENLQLIFYSSTLGMLLLGFLGWRWTYAWRREGRLLALATIFVPLPYILTHGE